MLLLGIDAGTSSVKVSVLDAATCQCLVSTQYPDDSETGIKSLEKGWAEQSPEMWWQHVQMAILKANAAKVYNPRDIGAIGIAYQMHGLVLVNKKQQVLRDSIIWCDSRAVEIGEKAFHAIGEEKCLSHLLNSPGNFTASKLKWVKDHEPDIYSRIDKILLPGDFISMKLTGSLTTSISALSEGIFWDFKEDRLSTEVMEHYGFDHGFIPEIRDVFSVHGYLAKEVAEALSLKENIPVSYKAGDQPNNALSLNVLQPGEVAATAGTSGVIYGVSDRLSYDPGSRINSFAHVNHTARQNRIGILLCINGTGILNRWAKELAGNNLSYHDINELASAISPGSDGLMVLPFGNGAERIFGNKNLGAHIRQIDLNLHGRGHLFRAAQEGIAFAFRYGLDIMRGNQLQPSIIRAGKANMFLSRVFTDAFVNATGVAVELYNGDGSMGAAIGAGIGFRIYAEPGEAFKIFKPIETVYPEEKPLYDTLYHEWKEVLTRQLHQ